jgi:hypothetical protein
METFTLFMMIALGVYALKSRDQSRRIAFLGSHLRQYQVEKLMESLTESYARALGEIDAVRREQIWQLLNTTELQLCGQFDRFVVDFSRVDEAEARVSKLPFALPYASRLLPSATFDLRQALAIHAQGIARAARTDFGGTAKARAFSLSAELFLMQHTCHWFCRSKAVASARLMARHKTSYAQVLAAVAPDTRRAYCALLAA